MKKLSLLVSIGLIVIVHARPSWACTSFQLSTPQRQVMAKNLDWETGNGMIVVNKENVQRTAAVSSKEPVDNPALWTSKYGNITFNQVGRDFPYGGMNVKGLSIEILWLNETEYPKHVPGRNTINESQWVQYMLDQAASISDVATLQENIQIKAGFAKVHYFVCEMSGACATFEFLDGELQTTILKGNDLKLITNNSYAESKSALKGFKGFGGSKAIPQDAKSISRFARAAHLIQQAKNSSVPLVTRTFKILDQVRSPDTQWSIVYDPQNKKIFYKTSKEQTPKEISFANFSWSCGLPVKVLPLQNSFKGDVSTDFQDYSEEFNARVVENNDFLPQPFWETIEKTPAKDLCGG